MRTMPRLHNTCVWYFEQTFKMLQMHGCVCASTASSRKFFFVRIKNSSELCSMRSSNVDFEQFLLFLLQAWKNSAKWMHQIHFSCVYHRLSQFISEMNNIDLYINRNNNFSIISSFVNISIVVFEWNKTEKLQFVCVFSRKKSPKMCFCMKKKIGSVACSSVKTTNFVRAYRFIVVINIDSFEIYINSSKRYVSRKSTNLWPRVFVLVLHIRLPISTKHKHENDTFETDVSADVSFQKNTLCVQNEFNRFLDLSK